MSAVELTERLSALSKHWQKCSPLLDIPAKIKELSDLQKKVNQADFWEDQTEAIRINTKISSLQQLLSLQDDIEQRLTALSSLLTYNQQAHEDLAWLSDEIAELESALNTIDQNFLFTDPYDFYQAILSIHVGTGGQDAEDFCRTLQRMYLRWGERHGVVSKILDESASEAGLRSTTIEFAAPRAYGQLKGEHGVHRLIRLSPFNAKNLRQTSFAKIEVLPILENKTEVQIDEKDLKIDVFRSQGAGGQSVNTTDSAVRITYLPLNLVVSCQNERSQIQNRAIAMKILQSRLLQLQIKQQAEHIDQLRDGDIKADFGSQVRTYTLQPYELAKDHRTNHEEHSVQTVWDGYLEGFVQAYNYYLHSQN